MTGLAVMSLMAASCSDDDDWSAGAPTNAQGLNVYIASSNSIALPVDGNTFEVTYARNTKSGTLTIPVNFQTATPEIFTSVPSEVTFAEGDSVATITITCSNDMEMFETYLATIAVDEKYTTQYADTTINIPRAELKVVKEDYKPYKTGTYYSQFNEAEVHGSILEYSEIKKFYRIKIDDEMMAHTFTFTVDDDGKITINEQKLYQGWDYQDYGSVYAKPSASKPSLYDPEDNTYYFGFNYFVSAGSFDGDYYDYFVVE